MQYFCVKQFVCNSCIHVESSKCMVHLVYFTFGSFVFTCVSYAEARNSYRLDVRPSVRLSVTCWYCIKTVEHIVMLSSPHDSPFILVLCISRSSRHFDGVTLCGAAKQRWGMKMSQFSINNLLYQKRLKIDKQRGVFQALNPLSIHVTFTAIIAGAYSGRPKCAKNVLKWRTFELTGWITEKRLKIDGTCCDAFYKH